MSSVLCHCTVSYCVYFGVYHKEMAIMKVSHKMGFRDSQSRDKLWYSATHFILQQETPSYENLWGICSYGVRVVLDEVPSRGHSFAWQSLLGVRVSKKVVITNIWLFWMNLGDKVVFVRFCLGWIMNSSAWHIVSFLSFSMFHPVSIHSRPNFIHFPSGFIQFFQQFELSSIYILHDFSIILKRFVGAFDPSEQSLCDQKRGGAKRNCSEAECVVLISVSAHSRKSGRARSYNQSFPTKLSKYRLENG